MQLYAGILRGIARYFNLQTLRELCFLILINNFINLVGSVNQVFAAALYHVKSNNRLIVQVCKVLLFFIAVFNLSYVA